MDAITLAVLLEYLYKKFAVTFILSLIGSFIKETLKTTKLEKMEPRKILVSAIFSSVLMCALVDYISIPFGIYAAITIIVGMWGYKLIEVVLNANFMKRFLCNLFKTTSNNVAKSINAAIKEIDKTKDDQKELDHKTHNPEDEIDDSPEGQQ